MNSKKTPFFSGNFDRLAWRLTLLFALIIPLVCTIVISPFTGMLQANSFGNAVVYEILIQISALLASVAFFAQCAVVICCTLAKRDSLAWKLFWCEIASLLLIAVFLKRGVLWLGAVIDEFVLSEIGSFAISNYTLAHIRGEHPMAETSMFPAFLDFCALTLALTVGVVAVKTRVRSLKKRGRRIDADTLVSGMPENRFALSFVLTSIACLLSVQIFSQIANIYSTVSQSGSPEVLSEYVFLILPIVYKIGFAALGYFVCQYVLFAMISRLEKSEKVKKR